MALGMGATLIDTAHMYGNQVGVAKGIKKSGKSPSSLFISTKVPGGLGTKGTIAAHEQNLKELGVETVDLLLTHFPCAFDNSTTSGYAHCSKAARQATWVGLESMYSAGKARAIGVSHYCQQHLQDILDIKSPSINISVNQQEWHVGMGADPEGVVSFCRKHGISYQSFSSLCGPCGKAMHMDLINGPLVSGIAMAHGVSGAQVSLKWLVQMGSPVVPKSSNPIHLREDLDLWHDEIGKPGRFTLTTDEMARLTAATSPPSAEPVSKDCKIKLESKIAV